MKKGAVLVVGFILVSVLIIGMSLMVILGADLKIAEEQSQCPDSGTSTAAYAGDVGTIRPPWVGAATYTSKYGMRVNPGNLYRGQRKMHEGADIAMTPRPNLVVSATQGRVKRVWTSGNGANVVTIDAGNDTELEYVHLASFAPGLKAGDEAWPGRPLGMEGNTGNSSGSHLHFQVRVNGQTTEPWAWMKAHGFKGGPSAEQVGATLAVGPPAVTTKPKGDGDATAQNVANTPSPSMSSDSPTSSEANGAADTITVTLPKGTAVGSEFRTNPPRSIPSDMLGHYKAAGAKYGVPWQLLAGIGMAETVHGRNKSDSYVGAQGPMQFMPPTFAQYGVDGNGDGRKDVRDPADSVFSAANYLASSGAAGKGPKGIRDAIWAYNHSQEYINSVLSYTRHYAGGKVEVSAASGASSAEDCDVNVSDADAEQIKNVKPSGTYETAAVAAAKTALGVPYVWGGGDQNGATKGGFDCSGFTTFVVAQATKKASGSTLVLPRTSDAQHTTTSLATVQTYNGSGKMSFDKMRPGDVITMNLKIGQHRHPWNHVAIYLGDEKMIHAPVPGKTVTIQKVADLGNDPWTARRPLEKHTGSSSSQK